MESETMTVLESETFAPEYRDRLRTWLIKMIHSDKIPGLRWENEEKTIFRMPWKHAGRQDYNLEEDSKIFMAWAKHSGRYREGIDKPEPIVWKTRLRCALNKMPDIRELPDRSRLDISEPYRVYQLLPPVHKAASQIRRRLYKRSQSHDNDQSETVVNSTQNRAFKSLFEHESDSWSKHISSQRRNSSNDTAAQNSRSPTLTGSTLPPANFWFNSHAALPLKSSLSPALLSGINFTAANSIPLATTRGIPTFPQSGYPLVPQLPFAFPATSTAHLYTSANPCLAAALRQQLSLAAASQGSVVSQREATVPQPAASVQKYIEQPIFVEKQVESNNKWEAIICQRVNELSTEADNLLKNPMKFHRKVKELESMLREVNRKLLQKTEPRTPELSESLHAYIKSDESQNVIENLKRELAESQRACACEREARKKVEIEREEMEMLLMRYRDEMPSILSDLTNQASSRPQKSPTEAKHIIASPSGRDNNLLKRSSSPLDLRVTPSAKAKKISMNDDSDRFLYTTNPSPSPDFLRLKFPAIVSHGLTTSVEKTKRVSPSSASSETYEPVTMLHHRQANEYRGRSLSPHRRASTIMPNPHRGIIKVT